MRGVVLAACDVMQTSTREQDEAEFVAQRMRDASVRAIHSSYSQRGELIFCVSKFSDTEPLERHDDFCRVARMRPLFRRWLS